MPKIMNESGFQEIRSWIFRNARPLELALWNYHFETGNREAVLSALSFYQNEDGGFGKTIEPDNWNPESTPYATDYTVKILRQIDFMDFDHPLYRGIFRYLENTIYQGKDGWFFTIPSNDHFPHAVWWQYSDAENRVQNTGTTASLCGFILRYAGTDTRLYHTARGYAEKLLDKLKCSDRYGDMGLIGFCSLFEDLNAAGLHELFELHFLKEKTEALMQETVKVLSWREHMDMAAVLPKPACFYYRGNEQAVSNALKELIEIRPQGGVWDIPWNWYNGDRYAKEFSISENWWKAIKAIEKLRFLQSYDRLHVVNA